MDFVALTVGLLVGLALHSPGIWCTGLSRKAELLDPIKSDNLIKNECNNTVCRCRKLASSGGISANCIGLNLTSIPKNLPNDTIILLTSSNRIGCVLYNDLTQYTQLLHLDLSSNNITSLEQNSFNTSQKLEQLYLDSNQLSPAYDSLPEHVFDNLQSLKTLRLHNNVQNINSNFVEYRDDLFFRLGSLQNLTIDGIPSAEFGKGFSKLKSLKNLEIYNQLNRITNATFKSFSGLPITRLNLKTGLNLISWEPESFAHFQKLLVLDLGYNQGLGLNNISCAWYGLRNTTIKELILTRLIPFQVQEVNIKAEFYNYLNETKIERFHLDRNNIVYLYPGLSESLQYVKYLDIRYNRLSNVGSLFADLGRMRNLKVLDASHQNKRYVDKIKRDTVHQNASLPGKEVDKISRQRRQDSSSSSACITNQVSSSQLCPVFDLAKNGTYPVALANKWCLILSPRIETYILNACLNVDMQIMPQITGLDGHHMKDFIFRDNGLSYLTGPFIIGYPNPNVSMFFDWSDNGFVCMSPEILMWTIKRGGRVTRLILSNNNLYEQLEGDIDGKVFQYFHQLEELYLDRNWIKSLPLKIFQNLSAIEVLNLSGNAIRLLGFEFSHMNKLHLLDLSNNLVTTIDAPTRNKIDDHIKNSNLSLNLNGNPIQCSCDTLPFLKWMLTNEKHLIDFNRYSCIYGDNQLVTFCHLEDKILVDLNSLCSTRIALYVSAVLLALAIMAVLISMTAYRHRWDIRYYLLHLRTHRKELVDKKESERYYKYDAFVIYHHLDVSWVRWELDATIGQTTLDMQSDDEVITSERSSMLNGEENNGQDEKRFRFCIHERDFEAGGHVNENILSSILNSRKMLLVMSTNFATSNWCNYELEMAISENVQRGFNTIVPVMLEPLDDIRSLSPSMQHIVRNLTYMEWPANNADRAEFWRKLKEALSQSK